MLTYPPCPPPGEGARCVSSGRCGESSLAKETWKTVERESGFALADAEGKAACRPIFIYVLRPSLKVPVCPLGRAPLPLPPQAGAAPGQLQLAEAARGSLARQPLAKAGAGCIYCGVGKRGVVR